MPKVITFDYLRTLSKDTVIKLVLELQKKFDTMEVQRRKNNRKIWQLRDTIVQLKSKRKGARHA
jgi:transposase-like protein